MSGQRGQGVLDRSFALSHSPHRFSPWDEVDCETGIGSKKWSFLNLNVEAKPAYLCSEVRRWFALCEVPICFCFILVVLVFGRSPSFMARGQTAMADHDDRSNRTRRHV